MSVLPFGETVWVVAVIVLATALSAAMTGVASGATHEILCRSCMESISYPTRSWSM